MLSDEDKERLRQEEIFRSEIRASLERPSNPGQRTWKLLNSAFSLWVLSSVVLTFMTWSYSQWQADAEENTKRRSQIERIDTEIAGRLRNRETLVRTSLNREQLYLALVAVNGGAQHINFDFGVFPEFRRRSLQSLLYELQGLEGVAAADLETALNASIEVQRIFTEALAALGSLDSTEPGLDKTEERRIEKLLEEFESARWPR